MSATMHGCLIHNPGPHGTLAWEELPMPVAGDGELVLQTHAAGLNRADLFQLDGSYPLPKGASAVPGLEVAGTVIAVGKDVTGWKVGDHAMGITNGNAFAEYVAVPASYCLPVPDNLSMIQAAALPEALFTLWMALMFMAEMKEGESFFCYGGASGVGHLALQIAKEMGCPAFAAVSSREKADFCARYGAVPVFYDQGDLAATVKSANGGKGVDVVLDMAGGALAAANLAMMAPKGRMITIALMDGKEATVKLSHLLVKQLRWQGGMIRNRTDAEKADFAKKIAENWLPWVKKGKISPVIHRSFTLQDAPSAFRTMQQGRHMGKIVLTVD